jgi:hypothetical protein
MMITGNNNNRHHQLKRDEAKIIIKEKEKTQKTERWFHGASCVYTHEHTHTHSEQSREPLQVITMAPN